MERLAKTKYTSHVIEHLAMVIGWSAGDSTDYLASTDAGCRFLALAVPLLTLGSPFKAAQELHLHLDRSSNQSQLLPTVQQLKDLLSKLEPKMMKAGFVDSLLGWHIWVTSPESGLQSLFTEPINDGTSANANRESPSRNCSSPTPPAYPLGGIIFDLTRALGELERIGEVTYIVVKTPACIAVWIIAFVDWCLGVKPLLKGSQRAGANDLQSVQQRDSKVLIEIFPSSADVKEPNFLTFKKMGSLDRLLGESRIFFKSQMQWSGMVKASTYFRSRVHDLQAFFGIFNVVDSLMVLIRDLSDRFQASDSPLARYSSKLFHERSELLKLLSRIFMDNPVALNQLIVPESRDVQTIWQHRNWDDIAKVAELFLEFLAASLFENLYVDDEIDIYLEMKWKGWSSPSSPLLLQIIHHLQGQLGLTEQLTISLPTVEQLMLNLIGANSLVSKPLIVSKRGQVAYLSFIETMGLDGRCMAARRVFPGALQYEGLTYSYAISETNTKLFDTLQLSKVAPEDISLEPFATAVKGFSEAGSTWFGTVQDDHISLYYVPCLDRQFSLDPTLFFEASEQIVFMPGCNPAGCPPGPHPNQTIYCRSVSAALSRTKPHLFRVLASSEKRAHSLFVKAALAELWLDQNESMGFPLRNTVTVARGTSCLPCACVAALGHLGTVSAAVKMNQMVLILD